MAAEDEQGESATPSSQDDNSQLTDSTIAAATPARPAVVATNSNNNSVNNSNVTSSTNSSTPTDVGISNASSNATGASLSFNAASNGAAGATNSSDGFLAAAAAEARQQQQVSPASTTAASNAVGDSTLLVDSTQKMNELTASSVAAVSSKLDQVRGYIRQTSTAMQGLEQQADLGKIGQYNTLVKVLRELKTSEAKLATHLATLLAAGVTGGASSPAVASTATDTSDGDGRVVPNSQSIGLVSSRTVHNVDNTGAPPSPSAAPSFSDRLAAGMEEANQITGRLRENVARREDLVERYRATRERLSALKRQRRDIQQQERSILLAHSSRESPYDDPIPGASSWSLDELNTGLVDFRALYDKVATLRTAYTSKVQALDEGDAAGRSDIDSKMQQLESKRAQLIGVITQLKRLRADKLREQGMDADVDPDDIDASSAYSTPAAAGVSSSLAAATAAGLSAGVSQSSLVEDGAPSSVTAGVAAAKPELQHQLSAAVDAMEETSVTDPVSRGGSVSIGTLPSLVSAADISGGTGSPDGGVEGGVTEDPIAAVVVARAQMEAAGRELTLRTQHLNNLREELAGMKRLLDVTQRRVTDGDDEDGELTAGPSTPPPAVGERAGEFITGVNGNIIRLSDLERQDPAVIEKYKQLSAAKQRMAQMEQIMQAISSSRGSGLPLNEVLSPEQLSLLEEAEAEEDPSGSARLRRSRSARRSGERDSDEGSVDRDFFNDTPQLQSVGTEQLPGRLLTNQAPAQPSLASLPPTTSNANNTAASGDRNDSSSLISSSAAHRRQNQIATEALTSAMKNKRSNYYAANNEDTGEVSEVQQRLNKPSNAARRPVNEETGRRKQQERWGNEDFNNQQHFLRPNNSQRGEDASSTRSRSSSSCNERTAVAAGGRGVAGDPRVAAIAMLQEELRQKKNALEALMRGMGKPSSLHPDNISDNISDGESGTLTPTPIRPARGQRGNRDHSVDFTEDYRGRGARLQLSGPSQHMAQTDGAAVGGLSRHQQRHHTPKGAVMSFNNLSVGGEENGGEPTRSVRPKQNSRSSVNRLADSDSNRRNLLGDGTNTQQTISEALQQLSTVQGSINSLYDTLRTERDARSSTPSIANNRQQMALQQQELKYQQQLQQQQQVLNNMFALTAPAPPSLLSGGVPADAAASPPAPLVSGLQQCFSQLYLHSLEIQALNKHIQLLEQRLSNEAKMQPFCQNCYQNKQLFMNQHPASRRHSNNLILQQQLLTHQPIASFQPSSTLLQQHQQPLLHNARLLPQPPIQQIHNLNFNDVGGDDDAAAGAAITTSSSFDDFLHQRQNRREQQHHPLHNFFTGYSVDTNDGRSSPPPAYGNSNNFMATSSQRQQALYRNDGQVPLNNNRSVSGQTGNRNRRWNNNCNNQLSFQQNFESAMNLSRNPLTVSVDPSVDSGIAGLDSGTTIPDDSRLAALDCEETGLHGAGNHINESLELLTVTNPIYDQLSGSAFGPQVTTTPSQQEQLQQALLHDVACQDVLLYRNQNLVMEPQQFKRYQKRMLHSSNICPELEGTPAMRSANGGDRVLGKREENFRNKTARGEAPRGVDRFNEEFDDAGQKAFSNEDDVNFQNNACSNWSMNILNNEEETQHLFDTNDGNLNNDVGFETSEELDHMNIVQRNNASRLLVQGISLYEELRDDLNRHSAMHMPAELHESDAPAASDETSAWQRGISNDQKLRPRRSRPYRQRENDGRVLSNDPNGDCDIDLFCDEAQALIDAFCDPDEDQTSRAFSNSACAVPSRGPVVRASQRRRFRPHLNIQNRSDEENEENDDNEEEMEDDGDGEEEEDDEDEEKFLVELHSPSTELLDLDDQTASLMESLDNQYQRLVEQPSMGGEMRDLEGLAADDWTPPDEDSFRDEDTDGVIKENVEVDEMALLHESPPPNDVLNNQVLPGVRANNYWDNFRSYTHQNLLSGSNKRNASVVTTSTNSRVGEEARVPALSGPCFTANVCCDQAATMALAPFHDAGGVGARSVAGNRVATSSDGGGGGRPQQHPPSRRQPQQQPSSARCHYDSQYAQALSRLPNNNINNTNALRSTNSKVSCAVRSKLNPSRQQQQQIQQLQPRTLLKHEHQPYFDYDQQQQRQHYLQPLLSQQKRQQQQQQQHVVQRPLPPHDYDLLLLKAQAKTSNTNRTPVSYHHREANNREASASVEAGRGASVRSVFSNCSARNNGRQANSNGSLDGGHQQMALLRRYQDSEGQDFCDGKAASNQLDAAPDVQLFDLGDNYHQRTNYHGPRSPINSLVTPPSLMSHQLRNFSVVDNGKPSIFLPDVNSSAGAQKVNTRHENSEAPQSFLSNSSSSNRVARCRPISRDGGNQKTQNLYGSSKGSPHKIPFLNFFQTKNRTGEPNTSLISSGHQSCWGTREGLNQNTSLENNLTGSHNLTNDTATAVGWTAGQSHQESSEASNVSCSLVSFLNGDLNSSDCDSSFGSTVVPTINAASLNNAGTSTPSTSLHQKQFLTQENINTLEALNLCNDLPVNTAVSATLSLNGAASSSIPSASLIHAARSTGGGSTTKKSLPIVTHLNTNVASATTATNVISTVTNAETTYRLLLASSNALETIHPSRANTSNSNNNNNNNSDDDDRYLSSSSNCVNDVSSLESCEVSTATQESAASSGAHASMEPSILSSARENDGDGLLLEGLVSSNDGVGGGRPGAVEPDVVVVDADSTTTNSNNTVTRSTAETSDGEENTSY